MDEESSLRMVDEGDGEDGGERWIRTSRKSTMMVSVEMEIMVNR